VKRVRPRHLLLALVALVVLDLALTSVRVVEQNEQGVVLRFGRVARTCPPGIQFLLPWPVETFRRVETSQRTLSVGIGRAPAIPDDLRAGEEAQWLTGDTNIVEIQAEIQYRVKDAVDYLFRVEDLGNRPVDELLRPLAEAALTTLVARMEVDDVLGGAKAGLREDARRMIQEEADALGLGLLVKRVSIVSVSPPSRPRYVIEAFNDVSSANADKDRCISEADGYAKDLLPVARADARRLLEEAETYRDRVVNEAKGAAERFRLLADEVAAAPEVTKRRLFLEAVERALARAEVIVYPHVPGRRFKLTELK
jgi:membrane protease subunit HflK